MGPVREVVIRMIMMHMNMLMMMMMMMLMLMLMSIIHTGIFAITVCCVFFFNIMFVLPPVHISIATFLAVDVACRHHLFNIQSLLAEHSAFQAVSSYLKLFKTSFFPHGDWPSEQLLYTTNYYAHRQHL